MGTRRTRREEPPTAVFQRRNIIGRSRYTITDSSAPHFLTFTVLNWLPVFTRPSTVQIILDGLIFRQQHRGVKVYGYVVLENHMHCILEASDLGQQVHDFKAFTAKEILRHLQENHAEGLLDLLAFFNSTLSHYLKWQPLNHPLPPPYQGGEQVSPLI